jgi:small subunit ribosomal protein S17
MIKSIVGKVLSNKMQKTVVVLVERRVLHPKYKKYIKRRTKLYAHDEKNEAKIGDRVMLLETRPLSKTKRWRVSKVL